MNFTWEVPTRIHFGTGICAEAMEKEKDTLHDRNALLVYTGHTLKKNGSLDKVKSLLEQNGCARVLTYCGHGANPDVSEAEEAGKLIRENGIDLIVGFGGGSAIDLGKGAAVAAVSQTRLSDYLVNGLPAPDKVLPIIAIPTTAGTGSELSKGAILSDKKLKIKGGIRGRSLTPKVAIVDAFFTHSMPKKLTMETGFDALAHAMESYLSKKANLHSENLSLQAIRLIGENLPKLHENLDDHEAREKMSYASMLMGMNLYNVGNCLPHRMQYPIGAATSTSHAAGVAALYPSWIKEEYKVAKDKVTDILKMLVGRIPCNSLDAEELMSNFLAEQEMYISLKELGIREEQIPTLAKEICGNIITDPIGEAIGICEKLYRNSIHRKVSCCSDVWEKV